MTLDMSGRCAKISVNDVHKGIRVSKMTLGTTLESTQGQGVNVHSVYKGLKQS